MFALSLMLLACVAKDLPPPPDPPGSDDPTTDEVDTGAEESTDSTATDDTSAPTDTEDTEGAADTEDTSPTEPELFLLTGDCEAPEVLPDDPLVLTKQLTTGQEADLTHLFIELVDMVVNWEDEFALAVGQGALITFDLSGDQPEYMNKYVSEYFGDQERYYVIEHLGGDYYAAAHRDLHIHFFQISDPRGINMVYELQETGINALAAKGTRLYAGNTDGEIITYDVSDPDAPEELHRLSGLGNVWSLAVEGDWLYAADNDLGIVAVDISDASEPVLSGSTETAAAPQSIDVEDGYAYVAVGYSGVEIFDLSLPDAPASVARVSYDAPVIDLDVDDGLVWAVNHEDVVVIDVADPESPRTIGSQETEEWAMCVAANGDEAIVGDWGNVDVYEVDRSVSSPEADPSRSDIYFYADGDATAELTLANRGSDTLTVYGGSVDDDRLSLYINRTTIEPGQEARVVVEYEDDGATIAASVCIATDDPDEPLQQIGVLSSTNNGSLAVGEAPVDFELEDIDGEVYRLSDYIGQPIVLAYFATW